MQALQQNPKLHGTLMGHDNVLKWFSNGQHIGFSCTIIHYYTIHTLVTKCETAHLEVTESKCRGLRSKSGKWEGWDFIVTLM